MFPDKRSEASKQSVKHKIIWPLAGVAIVSWFFFMQVSLLPYHSVLEA
jgi:hypothetical protein